MTKQETAAEIVVDPGLLMLTDKAEVKSPIGASIGLTLTPAEEAIVEMCLQQGCSEMAAVCVILVARDDAKRTALSQLLHWAEARTDFTTETPVEIVAARRALHA